MIISWFIIFLLFVYLIIKWIKYLNFLETFSDSGPKIKFIRIILWLTFEPTDVVIHYIFYV
jgi:hypothetical protein